ncbi:MAG TPA: OpgC domain-containing protein, partial [Roseiflexaceae bacterium]|nr:OpgC domain-containing protein [Roseiflexaceae bacterium]
MSRDFRIDFIRGIVLLLIVADHVLNNEATWFAFGEWMFFDGAATFVFTSGLVCGMVYSKVLARRGWADAQLKAVKRASQLYFAQIVMLAVVCLMFLAFERVEPLDAGPFGLAAMFEQPAKAIPNALLLVYTPWLLDILKLYIVLLLLLPSLLWVYERSRVLAFAASFAVYAFAQKFPEISPREYPHGLPWFWNPLGWQFLFFGAAALGLESARGTLWIPRAKWLTALAVAAMIGVVVICRTDAMGWMWIDRQKFAPMHVVSFAIAAYLVSGWLQPNWAFWRSRAATPIICCGRHSLPIFCVGVVIDYAVSMLLKPLESHSIEAVVVASGVALTLIVAIVLDAVANARAERDRAKDAGMSAL